MLSALPQLLTEKQAADYLNISIYFLQKARCQHSGPRWTKVGARSVRYLRVDLDAYILSNMVEPTRESARPVHRAAVKRGHFS